MDNINKNKIGSYATATQNEVAKAQKHIENRYARALKKLERKPQQEIISTLVSPPQPAPKDIKGKLVLGKNTPIRLILDENITSFHNRVGEEIRFKTSQPILIADHTIIPQGHIVTGTICEKAKGGVGGTSGSFELNITEVSAVDGTRVPLSGYVSVVGKNAADKAVVASAAAGLMGMLLVKGKEAYHLKGDVFTAYTDQDVWFDKNTLGKLAKDQITPAPTMQTNIAVAPNVNAETDSIIKFKPGTRKKINPVQILIADNRGIKDIEIYAVDNTKLNEALKPETSAQKKDHTTADFQGWAIVRHANLKTTTKVTLHLRGITSNGQPFSAQTEVGVELKE
ncbi:MAG: hypothetical protein HQM16_14330 [Deltaproteobacteria bacterium]|nr:hypothetical protein [Deltaproteobacteria bacterium]